MPDPRAAERRARSAAANELGALGERFAAQHLVRRGFSILARNARTARGEIDIVACDGDTIAFIEVKSSRVPSGARALPPGARPLERLGPRQRHRARALAGAWLAANPHPYATHLRLDAVGVTVDAHDRLLRLDHIEGAW